MVAYPLTRESGAHFAVVEFVVNLIEVDIYKISRVVRVEAFLVLFYCFL